jgi:TolB protein
MRFNRISSFGWVPLLCSLLVVLLVACGPAQQTVTPTPTARSTSVPGGTPHATSPKVRCPATSQHAPIDLSSLTGRIAFSASANTETGDIYVMNANCSGLVQLTTKPGPEFDPSWSPDGKQLVYRDSSQGINQDDEIYVMNADGSGKHNLTNNPAGDWGPAWSPDGTTIAFNSMRADGLPNIYLIRSDGSGVKRLSTLEGEYPTWSPDGKKIAFMSAQPGASGSNPDYNIYVMNADGSRLMQLTTAPGEDGWPAWSPDGKKIAFSSGRDDCGISNRPDCGRSGDIGPFFDIWVMNADGSGQTRLTQGFGQFLAWSPDGTKLVVSGDCGGYGLCVMNADGSGVTQLISGELLLPDWTR